MSHRWDSLECVTGGGAQAEILGMVEAGKHPRAAGACDGRQEAGGATTGALALVILEMVVLGTLTAFHPLGGK